mmetsp:Transcript_9090/g.32120  ORF Transcript_9090/g.32120 Transcript_9090/m.32120 type:complete len:469 (-) Transcript_9090:74-1480(-)
MAAAAGDGAHAEDGARWLLRRGLDASTGGSAGGSASGSDAGGVVSEQLYATVSAVSLAFCVLTVVTSLWGIYQHLKHYNRPELQRYVVRICLMVPVYALMSVSSLHWPAHALIFDTVRDVYEAWVVYCFLVLILEYAGGEGSCAAALRDDPPLHHPWPLCGLPTIPLDSRFLRRCKQGAIQFVVVKPVMAVVSLSLLAAGAYDSTAYTVVLLLVYNVSYTLALYALLLFYLATRTLLRPFHPVWKFLAVKSVVFATYWQGLLVAVVPGITAEEAGLANDAILSVEMFFFALLHLCAFSYREFELREGVPVVSVLKSAKDALNVRDVVADAYHNFVPAYATYSLHKPYEESPDKVFRTRTFLFGMGGRKKSSGGAGGTQELALVSDDSAAKRVEGDISDEDVEVGLEGGADGESKYAAPTVGEEDGGRDDGGDDGDGVGGAAAADVASPSSQNGRTAGAGGGDMDEVEL